MLKEKYTEYDKFLKYLSTNHLLLCREIYNAANVKTVDLDEMIALIDKGTFIKSSISALEFTFKTQLFEPLAEEDETSETSLDQVTATPDSSNFYDVEGEEGEEGDSATNISATTDPLRRSPPPKSPHKSNSRHRSSDHHRANKSRNGRSDETLTRH